jgi:DNA gyrase subunit A
LPVHNENDTVAVFTEKGYGKKTKIEEFVIQGRGGKGVLIYKPTPITGDLIGAAMVSDEENILLSGRPNSICIPAKDVPELGRVSVGNIMIKSTVISVVKI